MLTETYKGRKLKVRKGREWGTLDAFVNGHIAMSRISRDEAALMSELRAQVDWIDDKPVDGGRWGPEWYAKGTYTICERSGIHPVALGGECLHPYCQRIEHDQRGGCYVGCCHDPDKGHEGEAGREFARNATRQSITGRHTS